ncbi:protein shortage in chiasmata 1 ortholog-like [Gadus morhua]|uniref:protein shortage in chiasmata 1 ortholog-like n=1 Tax=Gadus morhua TaxID=8049 RepID=UPI0011B655CC|nr:protein shortage in chiasmata 1 ortholog-like [Gadus morhua]
MVLSTALELDLPLTPPTQTGLTLLWLSGTQLPLEQLSLLHRPSLVSQRDQQEMELYVWKAEKHLNCVLGFLLTEPQTHNPAVEFYPVSNALKELNKEILVCVHASSDAILQSQMLWEKGVPGLCFSCCEFTENLTSGSSSTKEPTMEDFTALSPEHIENILTAQEKDSVPEVSIKGVKSILKKGVPSDQPAIPMNFDTSTCAVRKNKVNVVSQVHQSFMVLTNEKQIETSALLPAVSVSNSTAKETFLVCETTFLDLKDTSSHVTRPASCNQSQPSFCTSFGAERAKSAHLLLRNNKRSLLAEKDPDPLSTFMMLRSQQTSPDPVLPQPCPGYTEGPRVQQPTPAKPQSHHILGPHGWPMVRTGFVASHSAQVQETEAQPPSQALPGPPLIQDRQEGRVACVEATESVWRAYCELLAVAQPSLSRARELGLSCPAWGDFSSITPDQTRFVLRQQEKELCRHQGEVQRDKELLFNQTALIHVLVTFKDMMLQCDLITAVEYLTQAAIACSGQRLEQLVKRLQVVVYLSHRNQEPNPKLLELQEQLLSWLQSRHSSSDKVLILTTVDSDTTATIVQALNQATGEAATAIGPEEGQPKLNGATVTNSVCGVVCVVACGQHIGADFPWPSFSLVVEYDRPGHSPWGALCKEKNIHHLCLLTSLPRREVPSACLEESVPFVLLVTDGLLNSPLLLQTLETRHNISVLERSYSPALQLFGGTQHYVIVTVNESTAIVIQDQEELGHAGYSERFVMRLTALSLQYSRCWLILHCPDSKAGGSAHTQTDTQTDRQPYFFFII